MSVLGRFLWSALDVGLGRSYGRTGEDTQDCVRFVVSTLRGMYPGIDMTPHSDVLHLNGQSVGSLANMERLEDLGVGARVQDCDEPGVYALQCWRGGSGHAFFLIRRRSGALWLCDFSPADCDGLEPIEWRDIVARWPSRAMVRLTRP